MSTNIHYPKARDREQAHCGAARGYYDKLLLTTDKSKLTCGRCLKFVGVVRAERALAEKRGAKHG